MNKNIIHKTKSSNVELTRIKIEKTYKNLLCGLPTKELNKIVISDWEKNANSFCETENIFFIESEQTEITLNKKYKAIRLKRELEFGIPKHEIPYRLPKFVCIAEFIQSPNLTNFTDVHDVHSYDVFGLIWFQEKLTIKIPENITEYIIKKSEIHK